MREAPRIGPYLRRLRLERGLSLEQLGERAGVSAPYLSRLEREQVEKPNHEVIRSLASALGVPLEQLSSGGAQLLGDPDEQMVFAKVREILETVPKEQWLDHTAIWEQVSAIVKRSFMAPHERRVNLPDEHFTEPQRRPKRRIRAGYPGQSLGPWSEPVGAILTRALVPAAR